MALRPGRPRNDTPTTEWKLHLPVPLVAKIDLLLSDPVTGKPVYGARSKLITELLRAYLSQKGINPDA